MLDDESDNAVVERLRLFGRQIVALAELNAKLLERDDRGFETDGGGADFTGARGSSSPTLPVLRFSPPAPLSKSWSLMKSISLPF